jgi:hypothetical protein
MTRRTVGWIAPLIAVGWAMSAHGQIYTCTAADGTRIFSDEKCGPDARVVEGIGTAKRTQKPAATKPAAAPRPAEELDALIEQCNAGDIKACNAWTRGGGPNRLKAKEREAEEACDAGSLTACEQRYCIDGVNSECRLRVLQAAKLAGPNWYLREQSRRAEDGSTAYAIRCVPEGARQMRDITISCTTQVGPNRCTAAEQRFAKLDDAAGALCGR